LNSLSALRVEPAVEPDLPGRPEGGALDFLTTAFRTGEGQNRAGGRFRLDRPWTRLYFGERRMRAGWWTFECEGDASLSGVEVRLSSASDPLILIPGEGAGVNRFHLQGEGVFDVSLLISPWPGVYTFKSLRLRRLTFAEEIAFLAAGAQQLLRRDRPFARLANVLQRLASGRPVGVRLAPAAQPSRPATARPESAPPLAMKLIRRDGITAAIRAGDALHPRAFELAAAEFAAFREARAVYADISEAGLIRPRPEWDAEAARWWGFAGAPAFFKGDPPAGAASPFEALKAVAAQSGAGAVRRIALPLASRPTGVLHPAPAVLAPKLARSPRVSIIIPTKFRVDLLKLCLDGLVSATDYPDFEVIVVDNGCTHPDFPGLLAEASKKLGLRHVEDHGDFNFPRLINVGVAASTGEIIALVNDDVQPLHGDWLARMVDSAMDRTVGAVGAQLVYPDGSIQHAGVVLGFGGVCGHVWRGMPGEEAARMPQITMPGSRLAVTGACLLVRRDAFDLVNGLDEQAFPVAFNDVDFCLRLRAAGLRNVYRGDAKLVHHESQSRGPDDATPERRRRLAVEAGRFLARWRQLIDEDPFSSPAFDPSFDIGRIHRALQPDQRREASSANKTPSASANS
jgi:GT2 family glycosyltransferase